jgi:ribosomal protein S18 acetylase RimI-like enzyme
VSSQPVISIRRGVASDAALLAEFAARTFSDTFAAENRPEDLQSHLAASYGVAQQTKELVDPNVITLLAVSNGELVAFAQICRNHPPACVTQEQAVEVHRFYVDRPAHGSGIARMLMSEVRRVALELGARHVWLGVWERNARAIAFYKKTGFIDVGSHDFYVGSDRQTDRVLVARVR